MDISIQPKRKSLLKRYWLLIAPVAAVTAIIALTNSFGSASYVADRDKLVLGEVQRGEFFVQIRGVGTLVPKNMQWLAANVDGRVDTIEVEPGAVVSHGDVIARLSNLKLIEQLEEEQWEMQAQAKEFHAAEVSLQSQLVDLRVAARNAELDHESSKLKLDAENALVERGIVSRLSYEQTKLATEQFRERIGSARERVKMMEANYAAQVDAHAARLNKIRNSLNLAQQQIDDLTIKASIDGVVQELVLKLGQQMVQGTDVARIAPHDNLVALLDVQEFQVRDISLGQTVTIDTRSSKVTGKVVRIDPVVSNGVVKVEVVLAGKMPPEARPDLSIEGIIDVERKDDALFVNRPSLAQSHSRTTVYVLDADGDVAVRTTVEFGRASTRHIEVLAGLKEGDRIIVSDPSAWESHERIRIR
jgi:multidrug efflux pump subunit AcrA (membrane-fusion protein)